MIEFAHAILLVALFLICLSLIIATMVMALATKHREQWTEDVQLMNFGREPINVSFFSKLPTASECSLIPMAAKQTSTGLAAGAASGKVIFFPKQSAGR